MTKCGVQWHRGRIELALPGSRKTRSAATEARTGLGQKSAAPGTALDWMMPVTDRGPVMKQNAQRS